VRLSHRRPQLLKVDEATKDVKWVQLLLLTPEQRHPMVVGYVPLLLHGCRCRRRRRRRCCCCCDVGSARRWDGQLGLGQLGQHGQLGQRDLYAHDVIRFVFMLVEIVVSSLLHSRRTTLLRQTQRGRGGRGGRRRG